MFANTPATLEISYANPLPEPVKDCVLLVTLMGQAIKIKYVGLGGGEGRGQQSLAWQLPEQGKGWNTAGDCGIEPSATLSGSQLTGP